MLDLIAAIGRGPLVCRNSFLSMEWSGALRSIRPSFGRRVDGGGSLLCPAAFRPFLPFDCLTASVSDAALTAIQHELPLNDSFSSSTNANYRPRAEVAVRSVSRSTRLFMDGCAVNTVEYSYRNVSRFDA